ncbi:hypothetical protein GOP47_0016628 [Adiantum capillus-veneris]|uniref:Large ribosomal subunit protein uL29c n=1 Tax=Adiantum capillus-veneris TaxID=13818 RepID=A0A9D4UIX9_ADICA|nr:hypothetical protein GOP47_0016628 [Adiantum capillus-veneris]
MAAAAAFSLTSLAKALPSSNVGSGHCSFKGTRVSIRTTTLAPCVRYRPLQPSMMAKREQELEELRKMSDQELKDSVVELKSELLVLRMKKTARQEFKSSDFDRMRKRIARMLTIHRERELVKGIKKRASRKLDKAWKRSIIPKPPPSLVAIIEEEKKARA